MNWACLCSSWTQEAYVESIPVRRSFAIFQGIYALQQQLLRLMWRMQQN